MRRWVIITAVTVMVVAAWYVGIRAVIITRAVVAELDGAATLATLTPRAQATIVYDRKGHPAFSFYVEQRVDVPLDRVSPYMMAALVAVEDHRFYSHHGADPVRIAAAAWHNFRAGRIVEGGSTLTQQLARASQIAPERTYTRKIREVFLATRLEERYSKRQILEAYLNTVYFGESFYGVEAAARGYFGKAAADLQPHEAALLAALVRSPSTDAPTIAPGRARERRNLVLRRMRAQGRLSEVELRAALNERVPARSRQSAGGGDGIDTDGPPSGLYFKEEVRRKLVSLFGIDRVLRGGLRVYTTYDPERQRDAEKAVTGRIAQIVSKRPAARDLQGSFVAMDPTTGDVLALVGGRDFRASSFNRATQARRQAGSAFKPIIYAAALERGYSPGTMLRDLDVPIDAAGGSWLPSGGHEKSEYTLRDALKLSSNRAAAQLLHQVGISTAVYYAHRLGIASELPLVPSLALGTGEVTLLELTAAYTAFANGGSVAAPRLITRVDDAKGERLYSAAERHTQAISPATAFLMSSMLSDVLSSGTGTGVRAAGFRLPAAGKTGTTDDYADAWFVGYTPHLVAGVWFGLDRPAPIMRGGFAAVVAAPAWGQFMRSATAGARPDWYATPADVEKVAICRLSGARATEACRHQISAYLAVADDVTADASVMSDDYSRPLAPVHALPPNEPTVYEDWFPIGAVRSEECPLHGAAATSYAATSDPVTTPIVDSILQASATTTRAVATVGTTPTRSTGMVLERVLGPDGVMRMTMTQRQKRF